MKNRLWIICFLAVLVLPTAAGIYYRAQHPDEDREQIEEEENRRMAEVEWDKLFDSCQSIDSWYNDRAPFRLPLMRFYRQVNGSAEMFFDDNIALPLDRLIRTGSLKPVTPVQPGSETLPHMNGWPPAITEAETTEAPTTQETTEPGTTAPETTEPETTEPETSEPETTVPEQPVSTEGETAESGASESETSPTDTEGSESADETSTAPDPTEDTASSSETEESETGESETTADHEHDLEKIRTVEADYEHWGYTDYRCRECGQAFRMDVQDKLVDTTPLSPRVVGEGVIIGRSNWLFLSAARSVEYYKGTNLLTDEELANYATPLVKLKERCDKLGIKLIVLIAPNKEQVYSEYMPTYTVENEPKREPRMAEYMREKGITFLYPIDELKAGDLYHETYFRYDTHWTPYGGFIADALIERELGLEPADPYSVDLLGTEKQTRSGDLIQLGGLAGRNYPEVTYFVPTPDTEVSVVSDETSENGNVRRTESSSPNEMSLTLVGDSFRVNMSDPLIRDFRKTLILHRDYLDASMRDEITASDVLIVEAVERFDVLLFPSVWRLLEIIPE